jgi:hypothetical protein
MRILIFSLLWNRWRVIYNFRNLPCIHTLYIFSCRFRLTISRRSIPSCSILKSGCEDDSEFTVSMGCILGACWWSCSTLSVGVLESTKASGVGAVTFARLSKLSSSSKVDSVLDVRKEAGTGMPVNSKASSSMECQSVVMGMRY